MEMNGETWGLTFLLSLPIFSTSPNPLLDVCHSTLYSCFQSQYKSQPLPTTPFTRCGHDDVCAGIECGLIHHDEIVRSPAWRNVHVIEIDKIELITACPQPRHVRDSIDARTQQGRD